MFESILLYPVPLVAVALIVLVSAIILALYANEARAARNHAAWWRDHHEKNDESRLGEIEYWRSLYETASVMVKQAVEVSHGTAERLREEKAKARTALFYGEPTPVSLAEMERLRAEGVSVVMVPLNEPTEGE